jgi:hypothetical protein
MSASPALQRVAAINAARPPLPDHYVTAHAARAHGSRLLTAGELWFLESVLKLPALSERQQARLLDIAMKVGRSR